MFVMSSSLSKIDLANLCFIYGSLSQKKDFYLQGSYKSPLFNFSQVFARLNKIFSEYFLTSWSPEIAWK